MDMSGIEMELNRMRADAMSDAGKKLELLIIMLDHRKAYQARNRKIDIKLDRLLEGRLPFFKRRLLARLKERLQDKYARASSHIRSMEKHRVELYNNVILQREALGITEHSWINEFYGEGVERN
ncbi:MAG: toxic anion resistance protein [Deferribacteraceae bacterium]|jgi:ribosomal protein L19|nr:toxic anion resistance protein [Deferribacteraceae bacterium]